MTDKPEATKVESTAHYHATKLDVLAFMLYVRLIDRITPTSAGQLALVIDSQYEVAERLVAELDRLNAERKDPS